MIYNICWGVDAHILGCRRKYKTNEVRTYIIFAVKRLCEYLPPISASDPASKMRPFFGKNTEKIPRSKFSVGKISDQNQLWLWSCEYLPLLLKGWGLTLGSVMGGGAAKLYICFVATCAKLVTNFKNLNAGQIKHFDWYVDWNRKVQKS